MAFWPPTASGAAARILFFPCGGLDNACARTRLYAYLPFLPAYGLRWHLASYTWHKYDRDGGHPRRTLLSKLWLELLPLRTLAYSSAPTPSFFRNGKSISSMLGRGSGSANASSTTSTTRFTSIPPKP